MEMIKADNSAMIREGCLADGWELTELLENGGKREHVEVDGGDHGGKAEFPMPTVSKSRTGVRTLRAVGGWRRRHVQTPDNNPLPHSQ